MINIIERIRQKIRILPYLRADGERTLRLNYDLNINSVVFDVGGYEGRWANDIFSKYQCNIHIFEPVPFFANNIKKKFEKNKKIYIHQFGLSKEDSNRKIYVDKDGSSLFRGKNNTEEIKLVNLRNFFIQNKIDFVDLMKINIEGGEYDLLEELIETGLIKKIKNIQVQFHDFVPNAKKRMKKIQNELETTHKLTYQFPFVWENWLLNE